MALTPTNAGQYGGGIRDTGVKATLQNFIPEIWGASIQDYMTKNLVLGSLATDMSAMVAGGGDRVHIPKHSELTTTALYGTNSAATLDTSLSFTSSGGVEGEYTLDVDQSFYSAVAISDLANKQSSYDVMNIYTSKLGYALAKRIDRYLHQQIQIACSFNHSGGSGDGVAAGNNVEFTTAAGRLITKDGVSNMIQTILENDGALEDYRILLCPEAYASLFKNADFARYDGAGESFGKEVLTVSGYAGKLGGVPVIVSNNWVDLSDGSAQTSPTFNAADGTSDLSDHLAGVLLHKEGLHIAYAAGMKARVQSDYNLESLSTRFVADSVFGALVTSDNSVNKRVYALRDAA